MKNGQVKKHEELRLYDVKLPCKIYETVTDGSTFFTVQHLDGAYSFCETEKGKLIHLSVGTPLKVFKDGYKISQ